MNSRLAKVALLSVSAALALIVAEASLRLFFHAAPQLELDIYRKQDGLLLLRQNLVRRHVTRQWDVVVRTNSEGWRDQERGTSGATVLGLGDSFAFGCGVQAQESFYSLVEQSLGDSLINAGVPGTATVDQERLLEALIPRYRPRFVVLAFFVGNDFTETGFGGAERLEVVDGLLELKPIEGQDARTSWPRRLAGRSHLLQLLRAVQFRMEGSAQSGSHPRTWDAWMREFAQVHLRQPSYRAEEAIRATLASLDRIADRCSRDGIGLAVMAIPRSFQIDGDEREEMRAALGLTLEDLDMDRPQRVLHEWAARRDVVLVDLLDDFKARHAAGARLYYSPDANLTTQGHQAAAAALAAELAKNANL
ncbi:MAG: GDSL-type esterase/lipase family protein [Acidobacteria bacterium]|nr:GDSL-type esterase/lipase family protein [Acidobacteriota bacterium]MDA1234128.1 GDSL-type esterase/lipase family protein [Acidobacteriota bacterium]